jgi:hypothetical protein
MRLLTRTAICIVLLGAASKGASAAEALIPPVPPTTPPAPAATAAYGQQQFGAQELTGSSAVAGQNTEQSLDAAPSRQRHRRHSERPVDVNRRPASASHVDRGLADQLTNQLNRRELQRMGSGAGGAEPQSRADELNREQLGPSGDRSPAIGPPPPGISRSTIPAPGR